LWLRFVLFFLFFFVLFFFAFPARTFVFTFFFGIPNLGLVVCANPMRANGCRILKVARNKPVAAPAAAPAAAAPAAAAPAAPAAGGWSFLASASAPKADDDAKADAKEDRPKPLFSFASLAKDKTGGGLGPFGAAAGAAPPVFTFKTNKLTEDGGDGNSDNDNGDDDNDDDKNDSNKDGAAAKTPASPKGGKNSGMYV
jgi:hypothetical protein